MPFINRQLRKIKEKELADFEERVRRERAQLEAEIVALRVAEKSLQNPTKPLS